MSTRGSLQPTQGDLGTKEALIIGAALMAMLIFLAMLRLGCNILIEVCILDELERARRSVGELLRCICPWWHVRTQPTRNNNNGSATTNVELSSENQRSSSLPPLIKMKSRLLAHDDFVQYKKRYNRSNNATGEKEAVAAANAEHEADAESTSSHSLMMCSICLHELYKGDCVYVADCNHFFHRDCMVQWVESKGMDCPNCRTEINVP